MKPFPCPSVLTVTYHEKKVGSLALKENLIGFEYDPQWLSEGFAISPFSLPLQTGLTFPKNQEFDGLFGVFAASLPGGWGSLVRDHTLAQENYDLSSVTPLAKLSLLDEHGLGALAYEPRYERKSPALPTNLSALEKDALALIDSRNPKDLSLLFHGGGSSGGSRPKVNFLFEGQEWIVKFPSRYDVKGIAEEEMAYHDCAQSLGIPVPDARLFHDGGNVYYGSLRFDRQNGERQHVISLSELLEVNIIHPYLDYGHLFNVTKELGGSTSDLMTVFSILCFNVFAHNYDDHAKNFSFLYDEKKKSYVLTPFYDLTGPQEPKEHELTVNGSGHPTEEDIMALAKAFGLNEKKCLARMEEIKKKVASSLTQYLRY
jgi:serine/threonine-protein kinase HipA